jgi:hypothetical protein
MPTKFSPREGHFERKHQSCPNSLVFHRLLSDAGKLLILALNGITTSAPRWVIIQTDLQARMGWGREKMRNAINDCVKYGYLKVKQSKIQANDDKGKKGQFSHNEFEFDLYGGYAPCTEHTLEDTEPMTGFPPTAFPSSENQPLTCSLVELTKEEEQTNRMTQEEIEKVIVVCSLEDREEKLKVLSKYQLPQSMIDSFISLSLEHLTQSCAAFDQYAKNKKLDNPHGCLRTAIVGQWKSNFTKQDKLDAQQAKMKEIDEKIVENRKIAEKMLQKYQKSFTDQHCFTVSDRIVQLKYKNSWSSLNLADDDFLDLMEHYLKTYLSK